MKRQRLRSLILTFIILTLFVLASFLSLIWTQGYRINWQSGTIQQTGLMYLRSQPKDAMVTLNGRVVGLQTPLRLSFLLPQTYEAEITKPTYTSWQKLIRIEPGQAKIFEDIILYLAQPVEKSILPDDQTKINTYTPDPRVVINGGELWYNTQFVSRFSIPILAADLMPDHQHIIYQRGSDIRVIEIDGGNDTLLLSISSEGQARFMMQSNGTEIVVKKIDGTLKKFQIR